MGFAAARGINVIRIETQAELLRRAREAGCVAHAALEDLDLQRFDAIVAFDVLEHIPQDALIPLFQSFASKLRPDGVVLCRVPNGESPFGRLYQHGDLTHRTTLDLSKFQQIGLACGLEIAKYGQETWCVESRNPNQMCVAEQALRRDALRTQPGLEGPARGARLAEGDVVAAAVRRAGDCERLLVAAGQHLGQPIEVHDALQQLG